VLACGADQCDAILAVKGNAYEVIMPLSNDTSKYATRLAALAAIFV
jgi:hypothetical protein